MVNSVNKFMSVPYVPAQKDYLGHIYFSFKKHLRKKQHNFKYSY